MKRFLIFVILGPAIGFAVMRFWLVADIVNDSGVSELTLLFMAYIFGFVPALAAGFVDHMQAERGVVWRPVWTGLAGFVVGLLPLLSIVGLSSMRGFGFAIWGLVGLIPAVICSLLSGRSMKRPAKSSPDQPLG